MDNNKKLAESLLRADGINPAKTSEAEKTAFREILDLQLGTKQLMHGITMPMWRIIMKNRITKLSAAASILITITVLFMVLFQNGTAKVWAAEETFRALDQIKTVYAEGKDWYGQKFMAWGEADSNGFIVKWHIENPDNHFLLISTPEKSYQYRKDCKQLQINSGRLLKSGIKVRSLFEDIQNGNCTVSTIRQDGEEILLCTFAGNDWKTIVEVDPLTKLPLKMHIEGPVKSGNMFKDVDYIQYNMPLPEDIFEFEVREDMTVLDLDERAKTLASPDNGIDVGDVNDMSAAKYIAQEYCKAMYEGNMQLATVLSPLGIIGKDERQIISYRVFEPKIEPGCGYGPVVKCEFEYGNDTGKRFNLIVQINNMSKKAVIEGYWSAVEDIKSFHQGIIGIYLINWPIVKVYPATPAEKAGMKDGDVITKINGQDISYIKTPEDASEALFGKIGDKISLTVQRQGSELTFDIIRAPLPDSQ
jgi:hypothetical protein